MADLGFLPGRPADPGRHPGPATQRLAALGHARRWRGQAGPRLPDRPGVPRGRSDHRRRDRHGPQGLHPPGARTRLAVASEIAVRPGRAPCFFVAHQARRRPAGQAAVPGPGAEGRRHPRQPQPRTRRQAGARRLLPPATLGCWSRPTSRPAASTSTTSTWWCTTTCRTTTRTTCTAPAARPGPGRGGTVVSFVEPFQTRDVVRLHRDASVIATTDQVSRRS